VFQRILFDKKTQEGIELQKTITNSLKHNGWRIFLKGNYSKGDPCCAALLLITKQNNYTGPREARTTIEQKTKEP
jgi:hypothetical protein